MHELSLMQSVMDSVRPVAEENHATKVVAVNLDIGEMTEVIEDVMEFAFGVLCEDDPLFEGAKLNMNFIKPRSVCKECGLEFEHDRFHMTCPNCGAVGCRLIEGRDLHIASIEIDTPDEEGGS